MEGGEAAAAAPVLGQLDPDAPTPLGPRSLVRAVAAEPVTALLVQRALVMELSHPAVAAGVAHHSGFRTLPLHRAWVTADAALRLVFGDTAVARGAAEQIYRTHDRIEGAGDDGRPYTAHDASLLLWVWATLVDTAEVAFTRWVRPFGPAEASRFHEEMVALGRFLGIPAALLPAGRADFSAYLETMLDDPELGSSPTSRETARQVLWFRHWTVPPAAVRVERALALRTLDRRLVERLGLGVPAADARLGERLDGLLKAGYRRLPPSRRWGPPAYATLRGRQLALAGALRWPGLARRATVSWARHGAGSQ
ncbi:MAG: DUF2236 domain-containing protein [Acidobacteriota bacterium]|nr:DUF2236 domain-containing protein [Acidobacteriota bacterium]